MNERFNFTYKDINYQGIVKIQRTFTTTDDYKATVIKYKFTRLNKNDITTPLSKWQIQSHLSNIAQKPIV